MGNIVWETLLFYSSFCDYNIVISCTSFPILSRHNVITHFLKCYRENTCVIIHRVGTTVIFHSVSTWVTTKPVNKRSWTSYDSLECDVVGPWPDDDVVGVVGDVRISNHSGATPVHANARLVHHWWRVWVMIALRRRWWVWVMIALRRRWRVWVMVAMRNTFWGENIICELIIIISGNWGVVCRGESHDYHWGSGSGWERRWAWGYGWV